MNHQRASQEDVATRSGIASSTMRKWRQGVNSPKLADIEAVINVLGGKLVIRMDDDGIRTTDKKGS
jgi:transcriptional regulator with XRE-family HTH domain